MLRLWRLLYTAPLRLRSVFRRGRVERELDEEMLYHVERRIEQELARGASPQQARRIALRAMEGVEQRKEECRDMRSTQWLEQFLQDIRYGWRALLRSPGFAAVVLASLALGIGANTAIFSLVDKVMLESLPVENPRELVILRPDGLRNGWMATNLSWSYPAYLGIRERQEPFTDVLAERTDTVNFGLDGETQRAEQSIVSGNYFELLGVRALLGRVLTPDDDRMVGGHPVAVLSHGFWVQKLGGRSDVAGMTIRLNGSPFTVVGVAEKGFNGLEVGGSVDVMVPASMLKQVVTSAARSKAAAPVSFTCMAGSGRA